MRFEQSNEETGQGRAAAIEDVGKTIFGIARLETCVHAAGLKIFTVGATRDFQVLVLSRSPDFNVVGFGAGESHIARAEEDDAIMKTKLLQNCFSMGDHLFQFIIAVLRLHQLDEFDFVELVHADHAARADASRSRFGAEAWAVGAIVNGKLILFENFLTMNIRDRGFRGGKEVKLAHGGIIKAFLNRIGLVHKFGELADTDHAMAANNVGRRNFGITVVGGVQLEQVLNQGAFEAGAPIRVKKKAAPGELCAALKIDEL